MRRRDADLRLLHNLERHIEQRKPKHVDTNFNTRKPAAGWIECDVDSRTPHIPTIGLIGYAIGLSQETPLQQPINQVGYRGTVEPQTTSHLCPRELPFYAQQG